MDIAFFRPIFPKIKMNSKTPYEPPRQRVWTAIRENSQAFTIQQVSELGFMTYESTRSFVNQLKKAGFVKVKDTTPLFHDNCVVKQKTYELIKDTGYHYPRMKKSGEVIGITGNKAMWNSLRILNKAVSADELAIMSSNEVLTVKASTANSYLQSLHQAGYLTRVQEANVKGGKAKYVLIPSMNTGAEPPQIQKTKQVFDPNKKEIMFLERPDLQEEVDSGTLFGEFHA